MRSRRDQLQAYQFLRRRIVAALLSGEPDSPEAPMRRIVRTAFAGTMIAVMIAAVFGVVGVIRKGGATAWQKTDTILIDKDSAAVYVWVAANPKGPRRLHPMVNLTSARLFLGSTTTKTISSKSLAGISRQPLKGIRDAPQSVPDPKVLIRGPWTVCERSRGSRPDVTLLAGVSPPGAPLGPGAGVVVSGSSRQRQFLVWKGKRFYVPEPRVLPAIGLTAGPQVVGDAWVSALPQGRDLTFPRIPDRGQPTADIVGQPTRVGQVFKVQNVGQVQYFVALGYGPAPPTGTGLAPISQGVAALIQAETPAVGPVRELSPAELTNTPKVTPPADFAGYPDRALEQATRPGRDVLCTSVSGSTGAETPQAVYAVGALPGGAQVVDLHGRDGRGLALADRAYFRGGGAALVQGQGPSKTRYLVTDAGKRFPIGGDQALQSLGLQTARVATIPQEFLDLLPLGPALSRDEAAKVAA